VLLHTSGLKLGHAFTVIVTVFSGPDGDDKVIEAREWDDWELEADICRVEVVMVVEMDGSGKEEVRGDDDDGEVTELTLVDAERSGVGLGCWVFVSDGNDNVAFIPKVVVESFDMNAALVVNGVEISVGVVVWVNEGRGVSEVPGSRRRTEDRGLVREVDAEGENLFAEGRDATLKVTTLCSVVVKPTVEVGELS
jgi:hypothetical protein